MPRHFVQCSGYIRSRFASSIFYLNISGSWSHWAPSQWPLGPRPWSKWARSQFIHGNGPMAPLAQALGPDGPGGEVVKGEVT